MCLWNSKESIEFPGAGAADGCELPGMGSGNQVCLLFPKWYTLLTTDPAHQPCCSYFIKNIFGSFKHIHNIV